MAGRRTTRKSVAAGKKEAQKTQNVVAEAEASKNTVASKADESKKAGNVKQETNEKSNADKVVKPASDKRDEKAATPKKEEKAAKTNETAVKEVKDTSSSSKTVAKKTDAAPKKRGRKPGSKNKVKEQLAPEVYLQYCGEEAEQNAIIEKIKEQYVAEGHRIGNIKSLKLYLKPEDRAAYYVINDRYAGKVELF